MPTSLEFQPAAGDWSVMPVGQADAELFTQFLEGKEWHGLSALGVLHAAQLHFASHAEQNAATLVRNHEEMVWPTPAKQFVNSLDAFGYRLRLDPTIDNAVADRRYCLFEGQMPPPSQTLRAPGLAFLRDNLVYYQSKGSRPYGFSYTHLTRTGAANNNITLGFANPSIGTCIELDVQLGQVKEKFGFPPKPLKQRTWWKQL